MILLFVVFCDNSRIKGRPPNLVPYTPEFFRKWQGRKRQDLAASTKPLRVKPIEKAKRSRGRLEGTSDSAPALSFSSRHARVKTVSWSLPPRLPPSDIDLVNNGDFGSPYLERYHFLDPSNKKEQTQPTTTKGIYQISIPYNALAG